jgi:hypothetical protein
MVREIETGKETIIKPPFIQTQWSKDGKVILGMETAPGDTSMNRVISLCAVVTGAWRQLTLGRLPRWSGDGSRIYFLRDSKLGEEGMSGS